MPETLVTIVVVPRDHFSDARASLDSIIEHSDIPYSLIYVDGGSPRPVAARIAELSARHGFRLIRTDHYLLPNRARNIGAGEVGTRYMVFIDNDVIVAPGWLAPLVDCAERTGAAVVGPLNYEDRPPFTIVHFAGGAAHIETTETDGRSERHLVDKIYKKNFPDTESVTESAEFHCMLVRTDVFREVGGLDEAMLSTRENVDFCMAIRERGHEIYLAPESRINYLPPERLTLSDMPYFALRWADAFDLSSFHHLRDKWNLTEDAYFAREYRHLGWRRMEMLLRRTLLGWLPTWKARLTVTKLLWPMERRVNRLISSRYARRYLQPAGRGGRPPRQDAERLPSSRDAALTE